MSRTLAILLAVSSITVTNPLAGTNEAETVTYADFTRVNYITSSMSNVYFATTEGVIRYDRTMMRWLEPLTGTDGIDHRDIQRIWVDMFDEKIYVQTSTGPYEYDLLFRQWFPITEIPQLNVNYVHVRPPSVMFAPPNFTYDPSGFITDWHGRNFYFNDMIDDRSGYLWMGIWGVGVAVAGSSSNVIELLPFGLIQNRVNAICNDNGVLWVSGSTFGAYRTGITMFDVDANSFSYIESGVGEGLPQVDIRCIETDEKYIYVGSDAGLILIDREDNQVNRTLGFRYGLPDDNILALKSVGDSLFVGTESGLCLLTGDADSIAIIKPNQFLNHAVYDFDVTDSTIWIASAVGGFQLNLHSGRLQKFQDPHNIVFSSVLNIEHYEDKIWMTSDGGLVGIDMKTGETQPFVSISREYRRRALAVNDRIAAVASDRGLLFYILDHDPPIEREFTTQDGLPSNNIYELLLDGDYLWIGSDRGLTRFLWNDPDRID